MTHNIDMGSFDILNFSYVDANVTMAADLHNLTDWMALNDTRDSAHEALYGVDARVEDNLTVWDTTETNVLDVNTTAAFGGAIAGTDGTFSGIVQGEQLTSTDDAIIADDIVADGAARIDETATVNALVANTTVSTPVDGLLLNSVIVPAYETLTVPISASSVDEYVFVADDAWWLVKAEEVHSVAGTEVDPVAANLTIRVCDDAEAVTGGINSTITPIPLNDSANTINTASLNTSNIMLANGDMIAFDYEGTLTGLRGSVTLTLRRM